jgi:hypothetical protein
MPRRGKSQGREGKMGDGERGWRSPVRGDHMSCVDGRPRVEWGTPLSFAPSVIMIIPRR